MDTDTHPSSVAAPPEAVHFQGPREGLQQLRKELAAQHEWASRLLNAKKLAQFASDLGFGHFFDGDIEGLWRIGLVRADVIVGDKASTLADIVELEAARGSYGDLRSIADRPHGYGSSMSETQELGFELYFHPFRVYAIHHIARTLTMQTSVCQFLKWRPGVEDVARREAEHADRWTGSAAFSDRFDYWNRLVEIAVVCEPLRWARRPGIEWRNGEKDWLDLYAASATPILNQWNLLDVQRIREDLASAAHQRDPNSTLHTLLRLVKTSERERIKGRLGAAMKFLEMAESIRRAIERVRAIQLPEEDELGPGQWMSGARKMLYGHERVFDSPRRNLRDFLGIMGLDFGVKARCYVEGETEYGALRHALGAESQCVLVNLSGNVAERGRKGVAFLESLDADKSAHVFSVVVIDADRHDELRLLRKAAREERFFGAYYAFDPDIELANFTVEELVDIAMKFEEGVAPAGACPSRAEVLQTALGAMSGKDFFQRVNQNGLTHAGKGESWGEALMSFAIVHPTFPPGSKRAGEERPLIDAAKLLLRVEDVGFLRSLGRERLDPDTGRVVSRNA